MFFRVKEVVDYVIEENMYCIINVHHDCGGREETWLRADKEMYENGMSKKYEYLWEQIAEYFKDYDEKLIFESFNEILDKNLTWSGSNQESYEIVNKLNQLFVDTVRNSDFDDGSDDWNFNYYAEMKNPPKFRIRYVK